MELNHLALYIGVKELVCESFPIFLSKIKKFSLLSRTHQQPTTPFYSTTQTSSNRRKQTTHGANHYQMCHTGMFSLEIWQLWCFFSGKSFVTSSMELKKENLVQLKSWNNTGPDVLVFWGFSSLQKSIFLILWIFSHPDCRNWFFQNHMLERL